MELALSNTDGDFPQQNAFLYTFFFIRLNDRRKTSDNFFVCKIFNLP